MSTSKEFTDGQKARIFKRDRTTCSFSGANLWLLDSPLRVGWQSDWVDHISPKSRGGKGELDNGACASHTFNMKKRNNSADKTFLFHAGHPTALFFELFGTPAPAVTSRLERLAKLDEIDWYFNRAVTWVLEALNDEWAKPDYKRKPEYWYNAAWKKLVVFRKLGENVPSLEDRKIAAESPETQKILLSIRGCDSLNSLKEVVRPLAAEYRRNSQIWWEYFHPEDYTTPARHDAQRKKSYQKACKLSERLTYDTFASIQSDFHSRYGLI
jgi:hypothetical protein